MEYIRVNLMLFQQDLNRACVQGLLLLSLQSPKWEPSPSPWCWIRREWKNPSSHWDPGIHLPDQTEKTSNRTSAPHLRSMTIIFMLMCKIFQILESPHTPYAGVTARRQERLFFSSGNSTGPGLKWQGIVMEVSRIANTSIITGQKRRRFSIFILPKSCSNSRSKQVPQGISEHTETFIGMGFSPSSVHSQAPKKCKSVYYWKWVWLQWAREGSSYVKKEKKE